MPEVRGTSEFHGRAYIPHVVHPLVRPHDDHHYLAADRRAETKSFNFDRRGRR